MNNIERSEADKQFPYYALANRGRSDTNVWLKKKGDKASDRKWEGELYRIHQ